MLMSIVLLIGVYSRWNAAIRVLLWGSIQKIGQVDSDRNRIIVTLSIINIHASLYGCAILFLEYTCNRSAVSVIRVVHQRFKQNSATVRGVPEADCSRVVWAGSTCGPESHRRRFRCCRKEGRSPAH